VVKRLGFQSGIFAHDLTRSEAVIAVALINASGNQRRSRPF
jgi:hypothetical protein